MKIAHLSDVHVLDLAGVPASRFFNKRLTGLVNLMGHRRAAHPHYLLEAAVAGLVAEPVDHVVVTGDLSNLALESEFRRSRALLSPLGGYERLSVIPGNHDLYTRGSARSGRFEAFFGDLMWEDGAERVYPWFKDLGEAKLLGFCSAYPTAPLLAIGRIPPAQLERLASLAADHALDAGAIIALVHHNLHSRGWRKDRMHGLVGREAFIAACAAAGVDVILHGHTHTSHRFTRDGLTIIGSGSSTWNERAPERRARYNVYDVRDGVLHGTEIRVWDPDARRFSAR